MVLVYIIFLFFGYMVGGVVGCLYTEKEQKKKTTCCGCVYKYQWQPTCQTCSRRTKDKYTTSNQYYLEVMEGKINE